MKILGILEILIVLYLKVAVFDVWEKNLNISYVSQLRYEKLDFTVNKIGFYFNYFYNYRDSVKLLIVSRHKKILALVSSLAL